MEKNKPDKINIFLLLQWSAIIPVGTSNNNVIKDHENNKIPIWAKFISRDRKNSFSTA